MVYQSLSDLSWLERLLRTSVVRNGAGSSPVVTMPFFSLLFTSPPWRSLAHGRVRKYNSYVKDFYEKIII